MLERIKDTTVYKKAMEATRYAPYSAFKLDHAVGELEKLLNYVHGQGFFQQYTKHGPAHSLELIKSLDWIIEQDQWANLSSADCLFILLSGLIHDCGMIITKEEFSSRDQGVLTEFVEEISKTEGGQEFLASIPKDFEYSDELIYEEFVRHHHPLRIRSALLGDGERGIGDVSAISRGLAKALSGLDDRKVLEDLGLICESHHRSDLDNATKYPVKSVHGPDDQAQVNIQAVSVILRIADVLQIGTGRTPSIDFAIISPSNPISHLHWMKEMGVRRVEGVVLPSTGPEEPAQHVIRIYGRFEEAEPFFALQNHLKYAAAELVRCVRWLKAAKVDGQQFQLFWDQIDTKNVEAIGFEREQFSFMIDREKILNLLIGHTLYNDTRVVLRELVQNSIDAVRLKAHASKQKLITTYEPQVKVELDNATRRLTITDNGSGMTSATIKNHLLTVGSSFYSSDEFKKDFPTFSPISRFGIGILTSFMVADEIEITTSHPSEDKARQIKINGASGTYLLKLISKERLGEFGIDETGTRVVLNIRAQSRNIDVYSELALWFGFPGCRITAVVDSGAVQNIGFGHPRDYLQTILDYALERQKDLRTYVEYEVVSCDVPDLFQGAYLTKKYKYGSTNLARISDFDRRRPVEEGELTFRSCGTFLQGIRVESGSPGFHGEGPVAVVNGIGSGMPKTNVARSGLEKGEDYQNFLEAIYGQYVAFGRDQVNKWVASSGSKSLTTLGRRTGSFLTTIAANGNVAEPKVFQRVLDDEKSIVVEVDGVRKLVSRTELATIPAFDTIDSPFNRTVENLIELLVPRDQAMVQLTSPAGG